MIRKNDDSKFLFISNLIRGSAAENFQGDSTADANLDVSAKRMDGIPYIGSVTQTNELILLTDFRCFTLIQTNEMNITSYS